MELESYSAEDWWRTADAGETYLDPPKRLLTGTEMKKKAKAALQERLQEKHAKLRARLKRKDIPDRHWTMTPASQRDDSEYDVEYEKELREDYSKPRPFNRDRDYARKNAMPTHDLICRRMRTISITDLRQDDSILPSILTRLLLDDMGGLLAEIRLELNFLYRDFSGDLYKQLLKLSGNTTCLNLNWVRSTLLELTEWV